MASNSIINFFKDQEQLNKVNELAMEENGSSKNIYTDNSSIRQSPLCIGMRISDMSPLADTIEISEDLLVGGGTIATD